MESDKHSGRDMESDKHSRRDMEEMLEQHVWYAGTPEGLSGIGGDSRNFHIGGAKRESVPAKPDSGRPVANFAWQDMSLPLGTPRDDGAGET